MTWIVAIDTSSCLHVSLISTTLANFDLTSTALDRENVLERSLTRVFDHRH